jgi:hypothetical protein
MTFLGPHEFRKLHRIADKKHRCVVADQIPIAFLGIEFDGEAAHVTLGIGGTHFTGAGVTLVPAMSLQGSWVTDAGIAVRREKTGQAYRSVSLAYRKSFPRHQMVVKLADIVCAILPDTVEPERR